MSFLTSEEESEDTPEKEIDKFISLPLLSQDQNTLEWWKSNHGQYPNLTNLAKIYLCVSATSVPAERVFSTAGLIVNSQRSSLSTANVDMLIFLNKNHEILVLHTILYLTNY